MREFISEIKKIECDKLVCFLSKMSIDMFRQNQWTVNVDLMVLNSGIPKKVTVMATAWDLIDIEYLSVLHSNDFRHSKKEVSLGQFVNLYREYANEHSAAPIIEKVNANGLFRIIMGMTAEQFQYQNLSWVFEKFNRDYYMLYAGELEHRGEIDVEAITQEVFGFSVDEYISVLVMVWGLCAQWPEPLGAFKHIKSFQEKSVFSEDNLEKFIQYYSCTYEELRGNPLGKQLLYSKPFIRTQRSKSYIASSLFLVVMTVASGIYWLVRDYYYKLDTNQFVDSFGLLFEDYIKELSSIYCKESEWRTLPKSKKKGADFYFDYGSLRMVVESKSSLIKLDVKQQIPNLTSADTFFSNTIKRSYDQLESSFGELNVDDGVPTIKVILLYDEFSNTAIIEQSMWEVFGNDSRCFIMTIREFEILLHLHCNDRPLFEKVVDEIRNCIERKIPERNIGAILKKLLIYNNPHFEGERDYFSAQLDRIKMEC